MNSVRIGNGCGFWGDNVDAPIRLATDGRLDYLTLEYLAELTMSILAKTKQRDSSLGYANDFLDVIACLAPILPTQPKLKIITNAGGMNPHACARKVDEIVAKHGQNSHRIAVVSGDDLMPNLDALIANGHTLNHLDTGESLAIVRHRVVSANVYLGAVPIAKALGMGANIVITGRVADASLTLGPLIHEFGWTHIDHLAAGTVAGHLIECGAQVSGGLWMNADDSTHLETVGYPIVEVRANGEFTVSKSPGTGGVINIETVSEQLLYEVADPSRYLTPDVVANFTGVHFQQSAPDEVFVNGSRGRPATDSYKVSVAIRDGFTASGTLVIFGPNAVEKARKCGAILLERLKRVGVSFEHSLIETLGAGSCVPGVVTTRSDPAEVVLRVAVRDPNIASVERFTKEFAPLVTSGYPGVTGYTTGRAQVREVLGYWPALIDKTAVVPRVELFTANEFRTNFKETME